MQWWQRSWQFVTKPSDKIEKLEDRQRAALSSAILFFLTAVLCLAAPFAISEPDYWESGYIYQLFGISLTLSFYGISRTRFYKWTARFYIGLILALLFFIGFYDNTEYSGATLLFVALPVILSALILSLRETVAILSIVESLLIALTIQSDFQPLMIDISFLVFAVGALTLISASISNTYRRQALDSETHYRNLMDANSEGIIVLDAHDARILDVNPALTRLWGYEPETLIGRYPVEFVTEESKELIRELWNERRQNITHEIRVLHQSGSRIYVDVTLKSYIYRHEAAFVLTLIDVTTRKQAEQLVVESEKRFRAIFNQSFQHIGVLEPDGLVLELNDHAIDFFGIEPHEALGKHLWDFTQWAHNDLAKEQARQMVERAAAGDTVREEIEARNSRHEIIYLDFSLKPVFDAEGQVTMLIAESRDKTAQRQAERQRIEFEHRYQALFNHTVDAVFIVGLDSKMISANERALSMLQYTLEEFLEETLETFIVPDEYNEARAVIDKLQTGDPVPPIYERRIRRKDGSIFSAEVTAMLVRNSQGRPLYIQSLIRDTTERKKAESERMRLLNALESSLHEIYIFDADSLTFQFVNIGAQSNLGYLMDELLKLTPVDIKPEYTREDFVTLLEPLYTHKPQKLIFETIHQRKNGSVYPVEVTLQFIEQGEDRTFLAVISDITERQQLEQEKFEVRVKHERTQVLQDFIEKASHHFRTPITNMKTSMYLLPLMQDKPEKRQHYMKTLNQEVARLQNITDDLLMMLRLQKSDTQYTAIKIPVNQLISEVRSIQQGQASYTDYQWEWQEDEGHSYIIGDKNFLSRALLNILNNAVRYTPLGGAIRIYCSHNDGWLAINIADNGMGIEEEDLPYIFNDFYRSNEAMTQDSTTSGLGLSITQYIIKRHRGIVYAQSTQGQGALFQVLLPLNLDWDGEAPPLPQAIFEPLL